MIALSALAKARCGGFLGAAAIHSTLSAIFLTLACTRFVKVCCHRKVGSLGRTANEAVHQFGPTGVQGSDENSSDEDEISDSDEDDNFTKDMK